MSNFVSLYICTFAHLRGMKRFIVLIAFLQERQIVLVRSVTKKPGHIALMTYFTHHAGSSSHYPVNHSINTNTTIIDL